MVRYLLQHALRCNAMQCNELQCSATRCNAVQRAAMHRKGGGVQSCNDAMTGGEAVIAGKIFVVGVGPGRRDLLTPQAAAALGLVEVVIGYSAYLAWIDNLIRDKECIAFG